MSTYSWLQRTLLTLGAMGVYALLFVIFYPQTSTAVVSIAAMPVAIVTWLFGLRIGLLASVLMIPLNALMLYLVERDSWIAVFHDQAGMSFLARIVVVLVVGRFRYITNQLNVELARRSAVEGALRESEARSRQLSDAAFEGLVIHDQGIVLDVNQACCEMFGIKRSDAIGMPSLNFAAPQYRELIKQKIASGSTEPYEVLGVRNDGTTLMLEVCGRPITYKGRVVRVAAMRDITERKRVEAQQLALAIAEKRAEFLKEFLDTVSHDLKTPLAVINSSLYLLEKITDADARADKLKVVREQTQRLGKLIEDILLISQLDSAPDAEFRPVDVNQLVQDIKTGFDSVAETKSVAMGLSLAVPLLPVFADVDSLNRVLLNLVENALNYTEVGGAVTITTAAKGSDVVIEVSDTGMGISETELPHIFDPYYRATKARASHSGGTGLGLAIVKRIIEIHKGSISVESDPGVGTTFRVCLPAHHNGAQA